MKCHTMLPVSGVLISGAAKTFLSIDSSEEISFNFTSFIPCLLLLKIFSHRTSFLCISKSTHCSTLLSYLKVLTGDLWRQTVLWRSYLKDKNWKAYLSEKWESNLRNRLCYLNKIYHKFYNIIKIFTKRLSMQQSSENKVHSYF